ncbi:hypothetical protein L1987_66982 [Smallanthus sonchifolius]|uniref:Uncharacterized protein n=1 Tax=Smallanthus sonchifolius TaxID=185202 RepID=A0ACB9BYM2_9ASTR|nr:hypothetical protein L1987_66982 [Smallanthus sonchifolius]
MGVPGLLPRTSSVDAITISPPSPLEVKGCWRVVGPVSFWTMVRKLEGSVWTKRIDEYGTFSMLPGDISRHIFDGLIHSKRLTRTNLEAFRGCDLQDIDLGEYSGVDDSWMEAIFSQGSTLLSANLSGSDVTDSGLVHIKDCENIQALNFNFCEQISDNGLNHINGLSNLTTLSLKRNNNITAQGMSALSGLVNLLNLDFERCPWIHGGLVHLRGLSKLRALNLNCCNCIDDADMEPLPGLINLESLNLDSCRIQDDGLVNLAGLHLLKCLELSDTEVGSNGLRHLSGLMNLERLNLSFTNITDGGLKYLSGLSTLRSLNLDVGQITNTGLEALTNFKNLQSLEICGGGLTDVGVANIKDLQWLVLLNLSQNNDLTDVSLELITGLTQLISLNLSNTGVTSAGLQHLKPLKKLKPLSLELTKVTANDIKRLQENDLPNLLNDVYRQLKLVQFSLHPQHQTFGYKFSKKQEVGRSDGLSQVLYEDRNPSVFIRGGSVANSVADPGPAESIMPNILCLEYNK